MIDNNLILYLPFDDPDGNTAYDYSKNRADAILSEGATLSKEAQIGKSLALNGAGECVTSQAIPLSGNFTICAWIKPALKRLGWILNFSGVDNYHEDWMDVVPGEWVFVAFVRNGNLFTAYKGGNTMSKKLISGTPTGFSLNDESITGSLAQIDEVRLFNVAKDPKDVLLLQKDNDVEYYIDGVNFKDMAVYVSKSKGLVGQLAKKDTLQVEWDNYHGVVRDKKRKRYKERTITLDCFIEAKTRSEYVQRVNDFFKLLEGDGNHRLCVEYDGKAKPLVYEVELHDEVDPTKNWSKYSRELMVGTFSLKLVEDEPVKRVVRHIGTTANTELSITFTSSKMLNIYWGDGSHTYNASGTAQTIKHTFEQPGEYDVIITGVIEDVTEFTTNGIIVWDLLK